MIRAKHLRLDLDHFAVHGLRFGRFARVLQQNGKPVPGTQRFGVAITKHIRLQLKCTRIELFGRRQLTLDNSALGERYPRSRRGESPLDPDEEAWLRSLGYLD